MIADMRLRISSVESVDMGLLVWNPRQAIDSGSEVQIDRRSLHRGRVRGVGEGRRRAHYTAPSRQRSAR